MREVESFLHHTLNEMGIELPSFIPELTLVDDLGIESLTRMELALKIEDRFSITFRETIQEVETLGDVVAHLHGAVQAA